jgi:hypothetical protein
MFSNSHLTYSCVQLAPVPVPTLNVRIHQLIDAMPDRAAHAVCT